MRREQMVTYGGYTAPASEWADAGCSYETSFRGDGYRSACDEETAEAGRQAVESVAEYARSAKYSLHVGDRGQLVRDLTRVAQYAQQALALARRISDDN